MKTTGANPLAASLHEYGFAILPRLYEPAEVAALLQCIESAPASGPNFRRNQAVFAIRNLLGEVPALGPLLDTAALRALLAQLFPASCHLAKAIYFDKPALSNWLVAWHQDLMINVDGRAERPGFGPWTNMPEGASVQPRGGAGKHVHYSHSPRRLRCGQRGAESSGGDAPARGVAPGGVAGTYSGCHGVRRTRRRGYAHATPAVACFQSQHQPPAAPGGAPGVCLGRVAERLAVARAAAVARCGQITVAAGSKALFYLGICITVQANKIFCHA